MSQQKLIDIAGGLFVPTVVVTDAAGNAVTPASAIVPASTSAITAVTSAIADTIILSSNAARKGAVIYNESTAILYLRLSSGVASATAYSVQVPANGTYKIELNEYTGIIKGIWAAANGFARVTEFA